jgi:hypothetical protein
MALNFSVARELVEVCHLSKISLFLHGAHGIGKSALVRQYAQSKDLGFVDLRLAQLDPVDLRGLPDRSADGSSTCFLPPAELPRFGNGILFLDELNRANREVLASVFQRVLDRRIGSYELPDGWSIVAAGNSGDEYDTNELDPAFRDRFLHATLAHGKSTFDEWASYLGSRYKGAHRGISFCASNLEHLETTKSAKLDFAVTPSRRSWEMVFRFEETFEKGSYSNDCLQEGIAGLIGRELAISYTKFRVAISPLDLLRDGVTEYADLIRELSRDQKWTLAWGLLSHVKGQSLNKHAAQVTMDMLEILFKGEKRDADLGVAFVTELLRSTEEVIGVAGVRMLLLRNPQLIMEMSQVNAKRNGAPNLLDALSSRPELLNELSASVQIKNKPSRVAKATR